MKARYALLSLFCLLFVNSLFAQPDWTEIEIPMSDGELLAADVYLPAETGAFPVILIQTPYNKDSFHFGLPLGVGWDQSEQPYAFVVMDWRGFYGSIGTANPDVNNGEDGYSAVEWIAEQEWSNGMIGTWGPSALGNVQYETAREQPPHLVCMVPQVSSPTIQYENYYPGGILRTEYVETLGLLFGPNPLILSNDTENIVWQFAQGGSTYHDQIEVPTLITAGWYDHNISECLYQFDALKFSSPAADEVHLLVGPWVHGGNGPAHVGSEDQGELSYPEAAAYNTMRELQFFDHHLLGEDNGWDSQAPVEYFAIGANTWNEAQSWPPETFEHTLWLDQGEIPASNTLTYDPPVLDAILGYTYDPEDPSPTIGGMTLAPGLNQGPYDQVPGVESRDDNLVFTSSGFSGALDGTVRAVLEFSSDAVDTDVMLRLTEVYPDGRSMLLTEAQLRLRYRVGFHANDVVFLNAGEAVLVELEFKPISVQIEPGNALRLIVSSSNYPRLNRNMNNGEAPYPDLASDAVFNPVIANNQIHIGSSRLILPATTPTDVGSESLPPAVKVWTAGTTLHLQSVAPRRVVVFDIRGKEVKRWMCPAGASVQDFSGLGSGVYVVLVDGHAERVFIGE